jgi:hypothetical protein
MGVGGAVGQLSATEVPTLVPALGIFKCLINVRAWDFSTIQRYPETIILICM